MLFPLVPTGIKHRFGSPEEYVGAAGAPVLGDARPSSAPPTRPTKPPTAAPTSPRGRKSEKRLGFNRLLGCFQK